MSNLNYYLSLLDLNYNQTVQFLLEKYGEAESDYFRELSYEKFMQGLNKSPGASKASRTNEGLYCHHIEEDKYENMANPAFIINQNIPFELQKKENLVYCDLVEHAILHAQITKESRGRFGFQGLSVFLLPNIELWYILEVEPEREWERNCKAKSMLSAQDSKKLIAAIREYLN